MALLRRRAPRRRRRRAARLAEERHPLGPPRPARSRRSKPACARARSRGARAPGRRSRSTPRPSACATTRSRVLRPLRRRPRAAGRVARALRRGARRRGALAALHDDAAGRQALAALGIEPALERRATRPASLPISSLALAEFTRWVDEVLEREPTFRPSRSTPPARRCRRCRGHAAGASDAAALRGGRAARLPTTAPRRLARADVAAAARGRGARPARRRAAARRELLAFAQLLRAAALTLLRRARDGAEPLAPSPLRRAPRSRLAERGARLGDWPDPRVDARRCRRRRSRRGAAVAGRAAAAATLGERRSRPCAPARTASSPAACCAARRRRARRRGREARLRQLAARGAARASTRRGRARRPDGRRCAALHAAGAGQLSRARPRRGRLPALQRLVRRPSCRATSPGCTSATGRRRWSRRGRRSRAPPEALDGVELHGRVDRIDERRRRRAGARADRLQDRQRQPLKERVLDPLEDTQLAFYAALVGARERPAAARLLPGARGARGPRGDRARDVEASAAALVEGVAADLRRLRAGAALPPLGEAGLRLLRRARPVPPRPLAPTGDDAAADAGRAAMSDARLRVDGARAAPRSTPPPAIRARSCVVEACAGSGKTWMLVSRIAARAARRRRSRTRSSPSPSPARRPARCASASTNGCAASPGPRSTHAERVAALLRARHRRRPTRRGAGAGARARCTNGCSRRPAGRGADLPRLVRRSCCGPRRWSCSTLGLQPDMELIEDCDDLVPAVMRAFHAAVLRDPRCAPTTRALIARARPPPAAQVAGRAPGSGASRSSWPTRPACSRAASSRPADAGPSSRASTIRRGRARRRCWRAAARARRRAGGAQARRRRTPPASSSRPRAGRRPRALRGAPGRRCSPRTDTPRKKLRRASPALADTLRARSALLHEQVAQHDAHVEHLRMVRLGARAARRATPTYKRSAAWPTWPTSSAARWRCCATATLAGWVQERLDARVRHLLIDEFQDTSPLQWHALHAWLAAYAGAGGGASGQRPPGVFIVGDPKQSIYRFRRAEPRVFEAAARLRASRARRPRPGLRPHAAQRARAWSRRSTACSAGRDDRGRVRGLPRAHAPRSRAAPATASAGCRASRDRRAATASDAESTPTWRDTLTTPRLEPDEVLREQEAARVADRRCADGSTPGDATPAEMMRAGRKRESLRLVADALRARARAARAGVRGRRCWTATPEAQDLVALLDAAGLAAARPVARARAEEPAVRRQRRRPASPSRRPTASRRGWWDALQALAEPSPALARARTLLRGWRRGGRASCRRTTCSTASSTRASCVRARPRPCRPSERRAGLDAIDAVLAQALLLDGGRYATPYGFVRALRQRAVKAALPVPPDAVRLLTDARRQGPRGRHRVRCIDADPEKPRQRDYARCWSTGRWKRRRRCAAPSSTTSRRCPPSLQDCYAREEAARRAKR